MIDNHVHTTYSVDSTAKPLELIEKAKDVGLSGICFTDHWDVGYDSINEEKIIPYEYSRCDLQKLRHEGDFEGDFKVFCGIEIAPMAHVADRVKSEMSDTDFDFILLSAHYVDDVPQVRYDSYFIDRNKKDVYDRYLATLISLIGWYDDYDALGHFDYISRYSPYPDPLMCYDDHKDLFDELFVELIKKNKALEINTGKHRIRKGHLPIDIRIMQKYRELGGELICLGSDAHASYGVGYLFYEFREILYECGFKSLVHYNKRKPVFTKI